MADAMCGPSNALQQFKQQSDVDRSLQQDRFSSRHGPAQGFRSQQPDAALLDADFDAFQAAFDPSILNQHAPPFHPSAAFAGPSQQPSWANDFQRLQISSPSPMQQQHHVPSASGTANWAQGFRENFTQIAPRSQTSSPSPLAFQQRARGFATPAFHSSFAQPSYATPVIAKGKDPVVAEQFDDAAFERAFEQAREDLMDDVEEQPQNVSNTNNLADKVEAATEREATQMLSETAREADLDDLAETIDTIHRVHNSDIEYQPQEAMQEQENEPQRLVEDDDALAATAQQLLEKVEHNQSDKFKNSQFLGLMRKLRDREVRVEGDQMVETANASSTSTSDGTLNVSSTSSERVYYDKRQPVPFPAPVVDTRPAEYGIPSHEQDHDPGRIDPNDGREVVDMLNQPGSMTEDMGKSFNFVSAFKSDRARASPTSLSDMLYGVNGSLSQPDTSAHELSSAFWEDWDPSFSDTPFQWR